MEQTKHQQAFRDQIYATLAQHSLLNHPFYKLWSAGKLTKHALQGYAKEYYSLEAGFPAFLLATEKITGDKRTKDIIIKNYAEETHPPSHKELWLDFAEALEMNRMVIETAKPLDSTAKTLKIFRLLTEQSTNHALASLLAYEWNLQQTAATKVDGLKNFYNITSAKALSFFTLHGILDIQHSKAWETVLISDATTKYEQNTVIQTLKDSMSALWSFLDGIMDRYQPIDACASPSQ